MVIVKELLALQNNDRHVIGDSDTFTRQLRNQLLLLLNALIT